MLEVWRTLASLIVIAFVILYYFDIKGRVIYTMGR
jgi:hypothetical protein